MASDDLRSMCRPLAEARGSGGGACPLAVVRGSGRCGVSTGLQPAAGPPAAPRPGAVSTIGLRASARAGSVNTNRWSPREPSRRLLGGEAAESLRGQPAAGSPPSVVTPRSVIVCGETSLLGRGGARVLVARDADSGTRVRVIRSGRRGSGRGTCAARPKNPLHPAAGWSRAARSRVNVSGGLPWKRPSLPPGSEIPERRVAGAEIINLYAHADVAQPGTSPRSPRTHRRTR